MQDEEVSFSNFSEQMISYTEKKHKKLFMF